MQGMVTCSCPSASLLQISQATGRGCSGFLTSRALAVHGAGVSGLARALGSGTARPEGAAAHPPLPISMRGPCPVPSWGLPATPQALFLTGLPRLRRGETGGSSVHKSESNRLVSAACIPLSVRLGTGPPCFPGASRFTRDRDGI